MFHMGGLFVIIFGALNEGTGAASIDIYTIPCESGSKACVYSNGG